MESAPHRVVCRVAFCKHAGGYPKVADFINHHSETKVIGALHCTPVRNSVEAGQPSRNLPEVDTKTDLPAEAVSQAGLTTEPTLLGRCC